MKQQNCCRGFLLLLTLLSVTVFAAAQDETKCYQISGLVPDFIVTVQFTTGLLPSETRNYMYVI